MAEYIKVKDEENLVRDSSSHAILNTDLSTLNAYRQRKQKDATLDKIIQEHESMKSEMREIKNLLIQLVGKN